MKKQPKFTKSDFNQMIAAKVIASMKTSGANWVKSWAVPKDQQPKNATTSNLYQSSNWLNLSIERSIKGYTSGEWATYAQWFAFGGGVKEGKKIIKPSKYNVKKGEKATKICFFKKSVKENKETGELDGFNVFKISNVFNADQIEGYTPIIEDAQPTEQPDTVFDQVARDVGAVIKHDDLASAYFVPSKDYCNLPLATQFDTLEDYAATGFHELTHWTGHESRLNRDLKNSFGSKDYAKEELCAELGAAMLCGTYGISAEPRADHAKYLNNWIERLEDDPSVITKAATAANNACLYIEEASAEKLDQAA